MNTALARRALSVAALALPLLAVGTTSAIADTAPLCKDGGYVLVSAASGETFANQGQCVAYVQHGGLLVAEIAYCTTDPTASGCQPR